MRAILRLTPFLLVCAACMGQSRQLFNGKNLDGWAFLADDRTPGFVVEDGELRASGGPGLLLYEREKFGDCLLRVVYRMSTDSGNSGVFIRIPNKPESMMAAANSGIEVQIDDRGNDWHCTGTLYSMTKAKARSANPAGEWNVMEIRMEGARTIVTVNGVTVTDYDGVSPVPARTRPSEPERGPRPESGYIGVQNHDARAVVAFKEISIQPIR